MNINATSTRHVAAVKRGGKTGKIVGGK